MVGNRIADAIAALATKMGATVVSTGNRVADNLDAIATKYEPASGGGGALVINLTWDYDTSTYTSDKTFAEISAAFQEGKFVYARSNSGVVYMPITINSTEIYFLNEYAASDGLGGYLLTSDTIMITDEDSVRETFSQFTLTIAT